MGHLTKGIGVLCHPPLGKHLLCPGVHPAVPPNHEDPWLGGGGTDAPSRAVASPSPGASPRSGVRAARRGWGQGQVKSLRGDGDISTYSAGSEVKQT